MFYKCSDVDTSTSDWFKLNTSSIPAKLLFTAHAIEHDVITEVTPDIEVDEPAWNVEPEIADDTHASGITRYACPEGEAYVSVEDFHEDLIAWQDYDLAVGEAWEAYEQREERDREPMWGTLFSVDDTHSKLQDAILASGLRVYEHDEVRGPIIGVDSCGHSFYAAYWIPLRARLVASNEYNSPEDRAAIFKVLAAEMRREGSTPETIAKILGVEMPPPVASV